LNLKEQDHLEEYDNMKIPINMNWAVYTGFICFTVGMSGRLLLVWHLIIGSHKDIEFLDQLGNCYFVNNPGCGVNQ
jgi:hypothetical protein